MKRLDYEDNQFEVKKHEILLSYHIHFKSEFIAGVGEQLSIAFDFVTVY